MDVFLPVLQSSQLQLHVLEHIIDFNTHELRLVQTATHRLSRLYLNVITVHATKNIENAAPA